jgi:serine/threonine protein kinase
MEGTSKRGRHTQVARGTQCYRAPELLKNSEFTNKVDIWALGCILCELATTRTPFTSDFQLFQYLTSQLSLEIPELEFEPQWARCLIELINAMLGLEPSSRPSANYLRMKFASILDDCPTPNMSQGVQCLSFDVSVLEPSCSQIAFYNDKPGILHDSLNPKIESQRPALPEISPSITINLGGEDSEVPKGPGVCDIKAGSRMLWIIESGMDAILSSLQPEHRTLIKGATNLQEQLEPLLRAWEANRSNDGYVNSTRQAAKVMYSKLTDLYSDNDAFDKFWAKKLACKCDKMEWNKFKTVTMVLFEQISRVDRILINNDVRIFLMYSDSRFSPRLVQYMELLLFF